MMKNVLNTLKSNYALFNKGVFMISKVVTVYDSKVAAYARPQFFRSTGEALRAIQSSCDDQDSEFSKYPSDFTFYEVAEFDDLTGVFTIYEPKVCLGTALELKSSLVS